MTNSTTMAGIMWQPWSPRSPMMISYLFFSALTTICPHIPDMIQMLSLQSPTFSLHRQPGSILRSPTSFKRWTMMGKLWRRFLFVRRWWTHRRFLDMRILAKSSKENPITSWKKGAARSVTIWETSWWLLRTIELFASILLL